MTFELVDHVGDLNDHLVYYVVHIVAKSIRNCSEIVYLNATTPNLPHSNHPNELQ